MIKPKLTTLKNGLRLLMIEQPDAATATTLVLVGTGSKYEFKEENGLSHFLEHMCFKGTNKLPTSKMIVETFDRVGSISNAFTSGEITGFYAKGSPKNIKTFINVLSDIYINSTLPESEIEKEKGVIIEEINMREDVPQYKISVALNSLMYGDQPSGWPIIGSKENVYSFQREDFIEYKSKHYFAQNTLVVVSGAIDPKEIKSMVEKLFDSIAQGSKISKKKTVIKKDGLKIKVINKDSDQAHVAIGFHSASFDHADEPALSLLATLLGRGMSSRLFQSLREEMGVAYYAGAGQESHSDHGEFEISFGVDKGRINEVLARVVEILKDLKENTITDKELLKAREYTLGTMRLGLESSDEIAYFYGSQLIIGKSIKSYTEFAREYKSVRPSDIRRVARKIFSSKNTAIAVLGPYTEKSINTNPFLSL